MTSPRTHFKLHYSIEGHDEHTDTSFQSTFIKNECTWCRKRPSLYWPFVRGIHRLPVDSPLKSPVASIFGASFVTRPKKLLKKHTVTCDAVTLLWRHSNYLKHTQCTLTLSNEWGFTLPIWSWLQKRTNTFSRSLKKIYRPAVNIRI